MWDDDLSEAVRASGRRVGFHVSIADGLSGVPERARARGCTAAQVFSRSPRNWSLKALDPREVALFRAGMRRLGIRPVAVHTQYLLNLASSDASLRRKTIASLRLEMTRAFVLGAAYVITHIGSGGDEPRDEAVARVVRAVDAAVGDAPEGVTLLLENSAGAGDLLGRGFTEIGRIIGACRTRGRLGLCLDVAHAFAAGYDLTTADGLDATLAEIQGHVGLGRLRVVHFNDSKAPLGALRDRHWHIGKGEMTKQGLGLIANHRRLRRLPFIMETPEASVAKDRMNMRAFLGLVG